MSDYSIGPSGFPEWSPSPDVKRETIQMLVMPANNSTAYDLEKRFPGRLGMIMSPDGWRRCELPYALDNGRFVLLKDRNASWDESAWRRMLELAADSPRQPEWIALPDMPGDADETRKLWDHFHWHLSRDFPEWRFAYVVQDGATPETVPDNADVIFVGGTTRWKRRTIWGWCHKQDRPVHVGRINTERWLWECHLAGASSCDGSGWFRGARYDSASGNAEGADTRQLVGLIRYLERTQNGLTTPQLELEYAATFVPHSDDFVTAANEAAKIKWR